MILRDPVHGLVSFETEEESIIPKLMDTPEVQIELNGDLDPGLLRPLDPKQGVGNQYLGVIMPMRL